MRKIKWGQLIVLIMILVLALWSIFANFKSIKYGLDLQGGVHLVLQASQILETPAASSGATEGQKAEEKKVQTPEEKKVPQQQEKKTVEEKPVTEQPSQTETKEISAGDLERAKSVIERRINALGVSEAVVTISGNNKIIVDIPGYTKVEEAKNVIGRIAVLTFKDEKGNILITGKNLKNATFTYQSTKEGGVREPVVALEWDDEGKKLFAEATEKNVGKTIAIYLDEEELMAPKVNEPIKDGNAVITFGGGSIEDKTKQAQQYAALLRGGSLPVKMNFIEERIVGPSLGRDTINKSQVGAIVAIIAIMIYLIIIYRLFGTIGAFALILYAVIYIGFLLAVGTVFSLPSIGAVILSFGMAVDSNIIVFERIKEEYGKGRTLRSAVGSGYSHGITAVLDSNFAMLLGMAVLWYFGTVQIKGFALTLTAGIIASLITSLFFTRFILETLSVVIQTVNEKLFGLRSSLN
jgi:preprotein translocase subunit SecD